jgi:hypothetical protein
MQAALEAEQRRKKVEQAQRAGVNVNDLAGGLSDWLSKEHPAVAAIKDHIVPAAARAPQPSGGDAQARALVAELVKAGASLQLAQETAAKVLQAGQQPINIEVVNATGGAVDAYLRGEQ